MRPGIRNISVPCSHPDVVHPHVIEDASPVSVGHLDHTVGLKERLAIFGTSVSINGCGV